MIHFKISSQPLTSYNDLQRGTKRTNQVPLGTTDVILTNKKFHSSHPRVIWREEVPQILVLPQHLFLNVFPLYSSPDSLGIISIYLHSMSDLCLGVEKRIFKEIMHFHHMAYLATPQHKNPCPGGHEIYKFGRPFLGHYNCIFSLFDLCLGVEKKIFILVCLYVWGFSSHQSIFIHMETSYFR